MKKNIIYVFLVLSIFSCKKDDERIFDESPDERLNKVLADYQAQLSSAQNGWKGILKTDGGRGGAYSFFFKFNNENRVVMYSDFDSLSAVTPKESSFRLKALQQPSLIFDTYSYLHVLSDPNESINGGTRGEGLLSDFEFYFDGTSADTINLTGRINGSKLTLVKATAAEEQGYINGQLTAGLVLDNILTYFKRLTIGTQLYDVLINTLTRQITFSWLGANGAPQTFITNYYFIAGGVAFTAPLVNGSQTINGFSNIVWNQGSETITLTVNNTAATLTGIVVPLNVDIEAPRRWWEYAINNGRTYWISLQGFHVDGVDDAFDIQSLTSGTNTYFYLLYWPDVNGSNDLFAPVFLNAAQDAVDILYATAPGPSFTPDGRLRFIQLGNYGPPAFLNYPTTGAAAQTRTLLYNASGYYFVQTGATSYDMVSAANGKSWITWELF